MDIALQETLEPKADSPRSLSNASKNPLRVLEARVYRGPSIYAYRRVIRLKLDLGQLEYFPTDQLGDFVDQLLQHMPTLEEHTCSYGEPGGFVRRLREGTWMGHVVEHIAIELQNLAGIDVSFGKVRGAGEKEGVYFVVYAYEEERVGLQAACLALRLVKSLLPPELQAMEGLEELCEQSTSDPFDFKKELEQLVQLAWRLALGPTTRALVWAARRRGIPAIRLDEGSLVQLGYGKYQQRIRASTTSRTSNIAVETASDKQLTLRLLRDVGLPAPQHLLIHSEDEAIAAAQRVGYPVVLKPLDVSHGRGVSVNLRTPEEVRWGFLHAAEYSRDILVEQYLQGRDFRILVIDGHLVAAAERIPAHVIGDGRHTIQELVDLVNSDPARGFGHEKVLTKISVNATARRLLAKAGYDLNTVLPAGEMFRLQSTANISTGGIAIDCTAEIHFDNIEIAERAARVIGLDVAGIDIISPDITRSMQETNSGIIEVNAGPGFRMHLRPSQGTPRDVAAPVIHMLFPENIPARIPIAAITGTNGKTTTARMLAHILKMHGLTVGLTTTDGIYIDGERHLSGDTTGPWSAGVVLKHPSVEAAVLETARGGIVREGLGFDRCDVGAVLNVQNDHLGLRGVETLEDLARVKSLIVEVVHKDGVSVLNGDDPLTTAMAQNAGGRVIFFSLHGNDDTPQHVRDHIAGGGGAVVLQHALHGEMIAIYDADQYIPLMRANRIPATLGAKARFNIANALAATAMAYALKVPVPTIRQGLLTFNSSFDQNPGRLNIYDELPFRVIMDYGHNPAAFSEVRRLVEKLRHQYQRTIGVIAVPGDRRDEDIHELGMEAGKMFDRLIIKEDYDLRGRKPGEVAALLQTAAQEAGTPPEAITVVANEKKAVQRGLQEARLGDLLIVFADKLSEVWEQITSHKKKTRLRQPLETT